MAVNYKNFSGIKSTDINYRIIGPKTIKGMICANCGCEFARNVNHVKYVIEYFERIEGEERKRNKIVKQFCSWNCKKKFEKEHWEELNSYDIRMASYTHENRKISQRERRVKERECK